MTRKTQSERLDRFVVVKQIGPRKRWVKTVFFESIPVAQFTVGNTHERKLAAIDLVERKLCSKKVAGEICGFHRNTVARLLNIKYLLGLEAVLKDDRGLKHPYKYVGHVRSHIVRLLQMHPDWPDQAIADQATTDLELNVSRSAVARIRTKRTEEQLKTASARSKQEPMRKSRMNNIPKRSTLAKKQVTRKVYL